MGFPDLMADMQKFGPQLQEMGYSFETASALMGQLDKAGVNTDDIKLKPGETITDETLDELTGGKGDDNE